MAVTRIFDRISVEEYLEAEEDADRRHEYVYGEIYAMAGASVKHNLITGNIFALLKSQSKQASCRVYVSDMKVRLEEELFFYPDVMVACQDIANDYYETNLCIIVEVVSRTTARTDVLEKRHAYLGLNSLQLYLLVDIRKHWVRAYRRIGNQWQEETLVKDSTLDMPCIGGTLAFDDIYDGISW